MNEDGARPVESSGLDIAGDGRIVTSDVWTWLAHFFFLPGDAVLMLLITHAPSVARFLDLSAGDYGSPFSKFVSILVWSMAILLSAVILKSIREFDRALTACVLGRYEKTKRSLRILRRKATSWMGLRRYRHSSKSPNFAVRNVELKKLEARVLRCYANVDDLRVLTTSDVAAALKMSTRQVQTAVRMLVELRLIEPAFGADTGRDSYHITEAGVFFLIDH